MEIVLIGYSPWKLSSVPSPSWTPHMLEKKNLETLILIKIKSTHINYTRQRILNVRFVFPKHSWVLWLKKPRHSGFDVVFWPVIYKARREASWRLFETPCWRWCIWQDWCSCWCSPTTWSIERPLHPAEKCQSAALYKQRRGYCTWRTAPNR